MKKPLFKPRQLLVLAYLLAAVFWVVYFTVGMAEALVCGVLQTIWSIVLFGISLVCVIGILVWLLTL